MICVKNYNLINFSSFLINLSIFAKFVYFSFHFQSKFAMNFTAVNWNYYYGSFLLGRNLSKPGFSTNFKHYGPIGSKGFKTTTTGGFNWMS